MRPNRHSWSYGGGLVGTPSSGRSAPFFRLPSEHDERELDNLLRHYADTDSMFLRGQFNHPSILHPVNQMALHSQGTV